MNMQVVVPEGVKALIVETGSPASEGVYRLGWWLADLGEGAHEAAARIARRCGLTLDWLEKAMRGELVPGEDAAAQIAAVTEGAVRWGDWYRPATSAWRLRPLDRAALQGA